MNKFLICIAAVVTVGALILVGCPDDSGDNNSGTTFPYTCENGTAATGAAATASQSNCDSCDQGYGIVGTAGNPGSTCVSLSYICENGMATAGTGATAGLSSCDACNQGYTISGTIGTEGSTCASLAYICENGTAAAGDGATVGESNCDACNAGYTVFGPAGTAGSTCVNLPSACVATGSTDSSIFSVYSEGAYAACNPLALAATSPFKLGAGGSASATFVEINGGANGTSKAYRFNVPSAPVGQDTRGVISLGADFDVSGKALRFSVKSPETGGTSRITVRMEADVATSNSITTLREGGISFVNDGTWKDVIINIDNTYSFSESNITAATVRAISFNVNTLGGVQTFDIDEVRFEEAAPNCTAPAAGTAAVDLIWGDAVYNSCNAISSGFYGAVHGPTNSGRSRSPFTFASNAVTSLGGGASSTPLFTNLTIGTGGSAWAYGIADFPADYDATGKALNFSIKSPATGGIGSIDIFLEGETGGPGDRTDTVNQMFTNDGTWQTVSVPITSFTFPASGVALTTVRRVVFSLVDSDGLSNTGVGAQTLDIDEIRFENAATCTAPVSGDPDVTLVFGDGNYASCTQVELSADSPLGVFNSAGDSSTDVLFEESTGAGANNTTGFYRVNVVTASLSFAGAFITLSEGIDITGKTLKFSVRSAATGGNNKIRFYIQDTALMQNAVTEAIETFTNNGTWQEVSIDVDTVFVGNQSLLKNSIIIMGFDIRDTDNDAGNGRGSQVIDIDEIRFE